MIELFTEKKDCCGCGACEKYCPMAAIKMEPDELGFNYPNIDPKVCVECGLCVKVCPLKKEAQPVPPKQAFAMTAKNHKLVERSTSGGVFGVIASHILDEGGVVYGAAYGKKMKVEHIRIENKEDLPKIQGSKYVQSDISFVFMDIKNILRQKRPVLFAGTPCQVAAIYAFVGEKPDNLYTIDLVCHGVPSYGMFRKYLDIIEHQNHRRIVDFIFRNKKDGWHHRSALAIFSNDKRKVLYDSEETYLRYFLSASLSREACYSCRYASSERPADITLCDYWGVEKEHPSFAAKHAAEGISGVICNTDKGKALIDKYKKNFDAVESTFTQISRHNRQLIEPAEAGNKYVIPVYLSKGWLGVEDLLRKQYGLKRFSGRIKSFIKK